MPTILLDEIVDDPIISSGNPILTIFILLFIALVVLFVVKRVKKNRKERQENADNPSPYVSKEDKK